MPTILDCTVFTLDMPGARDVFLKVIDLWGRNDEDTSLAEIFRANGVPPAQLTWASNKWDLWLQVLTLAAKKGTLRALMYALADQLAPALRGMLDHLPDAAPVDALTAFTVGGGAFDARLLPQHRAFLDRNPVRAALDDLASEVGARVLIVDGPSGSGRSHIWFLIAHGCARMGLPLDAAVRIQPSHITVAGQAWGPLDLMNEVAQRLDWPPPEFDPQAQPDTHVRMLSRWFKTNATARVGTVRWLVIDDVSAVYMTEACQRMAAELANAAATAEAGMLRIVLLGYSGILSADAEGYVSREHIVYLDAEALKAYFKDLAASVGEDLDSEAVEMLVSQAAGAPPYTVPLPFRRIGAGIGRVAGKYLQTVGGQ
ncbi:hypothetical protein Mycch_2970 [Mycolicibacterium chubuense NBB4]|uniref:Uncharacterized protein n=1 Tax=Mycolicibacterium chubuense (strain NBB4) TaxID=710421 RepID=I4BKB7_MYCCN|nr:hypothetical protein [Mycolicibacterium chubuense]AFM17724.1 hypothetical protein Mycch_2970 [Mycolicibacterium chubuense NBB4]